VGIYTLIANILVWISVILVVTNAPNFDELYLTPH